MPEKDSMQWIRKTSYNAPIIPLKNQKMFDKTPTSEIKALFLDIGGVLISNGWQHQSRYKAIAKFGLKKQEVEARHKLVFVTYESGKITHDEYLDWVIFYEPRTFSKQDFTDFMFTQSVAIAGSIAFFKEIKQKHQLKVFAVSNEGRELNAYRIKHFKLDELFDGYISSCYVHLHKPDTAMLKLASDISHTAPKNALYIDDGKLLTEIANGMGFQTLHFQSLHKTKTLIKTFLFQQGADT
ncbi:HAD family hydrolase [Dyadobacter frigoris]|uniref:HAD family hydrolase n=1 Tax=Dyadobacter frigoris TaxID=2576211 RepID=UPI0025568033|nr:HAD hydrolase-like protein [Dyadobacter frigoris]